MPAPVLLEGPHEPVAIVGMGCRWPGGVREPSGLWELLRNKRDGWGEFKHPRFSTQGFYHPSSDRPGGMSTRGGFLIEEDARSFDHSFFGINASEVETMDPSQRKLLEVVYEALESAGETWDSISGSNTSVYIGNFALDHMLIQARDWENPRPYAATGADTSILANRISYIFNLHGASLTTNTACSSSMYALHMAITAIRNGDCDGAICAASNWIADPSMQIVLDKLGALSPTSRCHTFDVKADGYARGEGYCAIYLKKASLAVLEQSPIRAMIRGCAVNANGRTAGITRPSISGQEDAIRKAYKNAGDLPFSDTTFFECHGTGTQAGDPIEVTAIGNVFASSRVSDAPEDRLLIGSIKTNLGHTEGASALAAIMKIVLSLEAGAIPPSVGVDELNPNIDFEGAKVEVVREATIPWPAGKLRRASVNSFGFGGANGHCVIDHVNVVLPDYAKPGIAYNQTNALENGPSNGPHGQAKRNGSLDAGMITPPQSAAAALHVPVMKVSKTADTSAKTRQLVLLPFSAHSPSSLQLNIDVLSKEINKHSLADVAYTYACKRSQLRHRSFRIVDIGDPTAGLALAKPCFTSPAKTSNVGFVFTGQGAQWPAMGARLFEYSVFRNTIEFLDLVLHTLPNGPSWTFKQIFTGDQESQQRIHEPEISQPACTALQLGLVDLLASWSVRPCAVTGHSSGEMAAAYAAGQIGASEAVVAAYYRGQAVSKNQASGAMLAVGLGPEQASGLVDGVEEVKVAAVNSPNSVTLSGAAEAVDQLAEALEKDGVFNRKLRTGGNAYHSHHMAALGPEYESTLKEGLTHIGQLGLRDGALHYPSVPWISSVDPSKAPCLFHDDGHSATYWRSNLESTVEFSDAVTGLLAYESGAIDVLLEIGPHGALKGPLDQIMKHNGRQLQYVSCLTRNEDDRTSMLQMAGSLFGHNVGIDLAAVNGVDDGKSLPGVQLVHGCTAINLPTYQYTIGPILYNEGRTSKDWRHRKTLRHDLLGSKVAGCAKLQPQWRNVLRVRDLPWLGDHRLLPDAVFPAAGYMAMAMAAISTEYAESSASQPITGFSLQKVDIPAALIIPEDDHGIEVVFTMELKETVNAASPYWARFTVSSVSSGNGEWTTHCSGSVKLEVAHPNLSERLSMKDRDVLYPKMKSWYDHFTSLGLGYGPAFQPLSELSADPKNNMASANLSLRPTEDTIMDESEYPIHPASLDATFQLGLIACHGGQVERATTAFVPIHLNKLYLRAACRSAESAVAIARGTTQGLRGAYVSLQVEDSNGDTMLHIDSLRCISYSNNSNIVNKREAVKDFHASFARVVWQPDFRTLTNEQIRKLFPPPEQNCAVIPEMETSQMICALIVAEIFNEHIDRGKLPRPPGDMGHFYDWIKFCNTTDKRENMVIARGLSSDERQKELNLLFAKPGGNGIEARAARCLYENMGEILTGQTTGLEVFVQNDVLTAMYQEGNYIRGAYVQIRRMMECLSFADPNLKYLEIGAGTGGTTREVMKALVDKGGLKRYADYTFTDVSAGFLASARESMAEYRDMTFGILDAEKDPQEQGFEQIYDVVIAAQAIHATASMANTLANVRKLLKPGGKLILVEVTQVRVLPVLLTGTFSGFWLGIEDGRTEGPFMSLDIWDKKLRAAGFSGTELHLDDYPQPHAASSIIVSTCLEDRDAGADVKAGHVHLLHGQDGPPALLHSIASELKKRNISCESAPLSEALTAVTSANSNVIALLDGENLLMNPDAERLQIFQHIARKSDSMIWLTASGVARGRDPKAALVHGLLREIAAENPAGHFLSIDLDTNDFEVDEVDLVSNVVDHECALQVLDTEDSSFHDGEFVWQDGAMWVSRVVPDIGLEPYAEDHRTPKQTGASMVPWESSGPLRAAFETPGVLSSLYFEPYTEMMKTLPDDQIEVKTAAVGVNWKDVGLCTGRFDANHLSSEYAGTVTKCGAQVEGFGVGDLVYGVGRGYFGNVARVPACAAHKLHPQDNLVEMATMPVVYMTVLYALRYVCHLRKGQNLLIQSATGGLGIAAIHFARHVGANIFVTVGSQQKAAFLIDEMSIPTAHIAITSRGDATSIAKAADLTGKGFDAILSTVGGGDMLYESLKALAPLGRLVDVGRLDVLEAKSIGLELFQKNASFSSFDLALVIDQDPALAKVLMHSVDELYRAGHITPIRPYHASDISQLDQVLQSMTKGTHVGKLVVTMQNPQSLVKLIQSPPAVQFDPQARYIITGGLGGMGRAITKWMADRGARDILVLSRREPSTPQARTLIKELSERHVDVRTAKCDVTQREQVMQVIKYTASSDKRLKGIIHAAVTMVDISFDKLSSEAWHRGTAAKVYGTMHLHEATLGLPPLDFFVLTTTTGSLLSLPTQSAYMAANHFQDSFARYRRRLGLAGSTVAYGIVHDIHSDWRTSVAGGEDWYFRNKALFITEYKMLQQLEPAILDRAAADTVASFNGQGPDPLSAANIFTCMDPAGLVFANPGTSLQPRWYKDGRNSHILRAVRDAEKHLASITNTGSEDDASNSMAAQLRGDYEAALAAGKQDDAVQLVLGGVTWALAEVLFIDATQIDVDKSVADHGLDSLTAAELRNWFYRALGVDVKMTALLDAHVSITELVDGIVRKD